MLSWQNNSVINTANWAAELSGPGEYCRRFPGRNVLDVKLHGDSNVGNLQVVLSCYHFHKHVGYSGG